MLLYYIENYCTVPLITLNVGKMGSRVRPDYIIYHNEKYTTCYYEHCPIEPVICASSLFKSELKFVLLYIGQHIESIPPNVLLHFFGIIKKWKFYGKALLVWERGQGK